MSAKLLATQIAGITMGVIGTALFFNAVDKATRHDYHRRVVVFDKLHRIRGELHHHGVELDTTPILANYEVPSSIVFDDFSSGPVYYYD